MATTTSFVRGWGGNPQFRLYSRQTKKEWREFERLQKEIEEDVRELEFRERLAAGGPEVERAIAQVRKTMFPNIE